MGAANLLSTQRIQNIIWRRHYVRGKDADVKAERLAQTLLAMGYGFYSLDAARQSAENRPERIPSTQVMAYVMRQRPEGEHPNILAVLG